MPDSNVNRRAGDSDIQNIICQNYPDMSVHGERRGEEGGGRGGASH